MTEAQAQCLEAEHVRLRALALTDRADILRYAGAKAIADGTFVPHPYPPEAAAEFIQKTLEARDNKTGFTFSIRDRESDRFVGCMGIHPVLEHGRADVGYWVGLPFWGRGYASAALRRLIQFGFDALELNRIEAGHFVDNPASGRVMQKAGMRFEGLRRGYMRHREIYRDARWYVILRADWEAAKTKETAED